MGPNGASCGKSAPNDGVESSQVSQDERANGIKRDEPEHGPCPSPIKNQVAISTGGVSAPKQTNKRRHLAELGPIKTSAASQQRRRLNQTQLGPPHPAKLSAQQRRPRRKGLKVAPTALGGNGLNGAQNTSGPRATMLATAGEAAARPVAQQQPADAHLDYTCSGCHRPIRERYLLRACGQHWHNNCLKCDRCQAPLGELGPSFYAAGNMNLCRQDYYELFAHKAICAVCDKLIYASEMVMRARDNVYHLECFACQLCGLRFCVGDRFHLCENKIVCQFDYDEHIYPIEQQQHYAQYYPQTGVQNQASGWMQLLDGVQQANEVPSRATQAQQSHCEASGHLQEFGATDQANCREVLVYHTMESGGAAEPIKPETDQQIARPPTAGANSQPPTELQSQAQGSSGEVTNAREKDSGSVGAVEGELTLEPASG